METCLFNKTKTYRHDLKISNPPNSQLILNVNEFNSVKNAGPPIEYHNAGFIYNSINTTLRIQKLHNFNNFNLARSKVNFVIKTDRNGQNEEHKIAGELIDVSISKRDDDSLADYFRNYATAFNDYNLSYYKNYGFSHTLFNQFSEELKTSLVIEEANKNFIDSFVFKAFSYKYCVKDLVRILFKDSSYPWEDQKYKKRIGRLIYLILIDLLNKENDNFNRLKLINRLISIINTLYQTWESGNPFLFNLQLKVVNLIL